MKTQRMIYWTIVLVGIVATAEMAVADKKPLHDYNMVIVQPFETAVEGTFGRPDATRVALTQAVREGKLFSDVLMAEQVKPGEGPGEKALVLKLEG
jgi:hypothetical protein